MVSRRLDGPILEALRALFDPHECSSDEGNGCICLFTFHVPFDEWPQVWHYQSENSIWFEYTVGFL